jgi:transposase InsO family protein
LLKLGIRISPRTVRRYIPKAPGRPVDPKHRWMTFVRNHAQAIIASDFFLVITATFQLVYVFVIIEVASRRVLHFNATRHPTAEWTLQQFRECIAGDEGYRFVIHDRDRIYSGDLDAALRALGLTVLKTPPKAPKANAICERWIGSARRECLDFIIPISKAHIRQRSNLGWGITIAAVHTPVLDREYRIHVHRRQSFKPNGIVFRKIAESRGHRSLAVCITSIGWKELRPDGHSICPNVFFADDNPVCAAKKTGPFISARAL